MVDINAFLQFLQHSHGFSEILRNILRHDSHFPVAVCLPLSCLPDCRHILIEEDDQHFGNTDGSIGCKKQYEESLEIIYKAPTGRLLTIHFQVQEDADHISCQYHRISDHHKPHVHVYHHGNDQRNRICPGLFCRIEQYDNYIPHSHGRSDQHLSGMCPLPEQIPQNRHYNDQYRCDQLDQYFS